jgi:predicted DNA-binding protein with PD1-like motif
MAETAAWELDARAPDEYHYVEAQRGREFIIRLTTGADVFLALQKFAIDQKIEFAKIHACFMGALQPAKYLMWAPDPKDPGNWHREAVATVGNLSMICAMGGMIHPRPGANGQSEPFPAIHFVAGGAWDCPTFGGHLEQGSIVKGVLECFITEILGIENLAPKVRVYEDDEYPENWYKSLA